MPAISYVIPVYDDPDGIRETVTSIERTAYPEYEIEAVLTPSTGETRAALDDLAERFDSLTVHVEERHRTPGAARNVGLDAADGDVIVFVDADMRVEEAFPRKVARVFRASSIDYLGYPVSIDPPEGEETVFGFYDRSVRFPVEYCMEAVDFCPTCSLAVRSEVVEDGPRFEPDLVSAEDVVFGHRVAERGYTFGFCPDVEVAHPARNSLGAIYGKGEKTGRGFYQVYEWLPDEHLRSRSLLRSSEAYLPHSPGYLGKLVRDWERRSAREKALLHAVEYVENLARTWGYLAESVRDTLGRSESDARDPEPAS